MAKTNEVFVTVAIPRGLRALARQYAKTTDLKLKAVVKIALEEYLNRKMADVSVEAQ